MNEIVMIIGLMCNINYEDAIYPKEEKIQCVEFYANCLIGPNGVYLKEELNKCQTKYKRRKNENKRVSIPI